MQDTGAGPGVCSGKPRVDSVEVLGAFLANGRFSAPVWSVRMPAHVARSAARFGCYPARISLYALSTPWKIQGSFRKGLECVPSGAAGLEDRGSCAIWRTESSIALHFLLGWGSIIPPQFPAPPFQGLGQGSGTPSLGNELEIKASEPFRGQEVSPEHTWGGHPSSRDTVKS